ncbi:hypothetical protein ABTL63_19490, partial [Acinetobacter baumannii]
PTHRCFRVAIGQRDRRLIGLGLQAVGRTDLRADRRARRLGEALGKVDIGGADAHPCCLAPISADRQRPTTGPDAGIGGAART